MLRKYNVRDRFLDFWEVEKCERRIELNRKKEKKILFLLRRGERREVRGRGGKMLTRYEGLMCVINF